jgi:hypothetical protein
MGQILLALIVFGNPLLVSRFNSWLESGHAGSDAERIRAVDYIGGQLRSQGRSQAAIGYQINLRLHAGLFTFWIRSTRSEPNSIFISSTGTESRTQTVVPRAHHPEMSTGLCNRFRTVWKITVFPLPANIGSHFQSVAQFRSYQVFKRYQLDEEQVRR